MTQKKIKTSERLHELYNIVLVVVGGILQGVGLELFLIPNQFLDGGVVGVSIITGNYIDLPIGVFIAVLNIPFVIVTWRTLGRRVAVKTVIGIASLAASTVLLHHQEPLTDNFSLALGYGGLLLGLGTGLALRAGGALDGTEALASVLSHKSKWSVDQLILGINIAIFGVAAFVLTPETAMASALLFYIVVAPIIKRVVDGGNELRLAEVITDKPEEVATAIHTQNHRRIVSSKLKTVLNDGTLGEMFSLRVILSRMEESVIGDLILEADPDSIVIFKEVSNVRGGIYEDSDH